MADAKTLFEIVKGAIGVLKDVVTIAVAIGGALLAFGIWAIAGLPKFRLHVIFWFPTTSPPDTPYPLSVQFEVFTGAVGAKVTTEIEIESLTVTQSGHPPCRLTPFTFLEPVALTEKAPTFAARTTEFSRAFLLEGSGSLVKHVGFHCDVHQVLTPVAGDLALRLRVHYKTYDPIRQAMSLVKLARSPVCRTAAYHFERKIDAEEANHLTQKQTSMWLYWHVKTREE